ncbi:protein of unknown function [Burkholderia multivorans]
MCCPYRVRIMQSIGCRAAAPPECLLHLLLWWIKPEPGVRAFFRLMQISARVARRPFGGFAVRVPVRAGRLPLRCGLPVPDVRHRAGRGLRRDVAARAEMADAVPHRAQPRDALVRALLAGGRDARVERRQFCIAARAIGVGR